MQPSSQALTPRTQNTVSATKRGAVYSAFGDEPAAGNYEVALWTNRLKIAFPSMPADFWGLVSRKATAECLSKSRLDYIEAKLLSDYIYNTLTVADIFKHDIEVEQITYEQLKSSEYIGVPVAVVEWNNRKLVLSVDTAEKRKLSYKRMAMQPSGYMKEV